MTSPNLDNHDQAERNAEAILTQQAGQAAERLTDHESLKKARKHYEKAKKLTSDARHLAAAVMNMLTSVAVVVSVLLGAKNVRVAGQQLDIANQQLAAIDAVGSKSGERDHEWQKALEQMRINEAVHAGARAWVGGFETPDKLIRGTTPEIVQITLQSLINEPLEGRLRAKTRNGSWSMMCLLPGCVTPGEDSCACSNPVNYSFVLEPMHQLRIGLPITLQPDPEAPCSRELTVDYEFEIQDAKGRLQTLDKRRVTYERSPAFETCTANVEYHHAVGDSWAGEPVVKRRKSENTADDEGEASADIVGNEVDTNESESGASDSDDSPAP